MSRKLISLLLAAMLMLAFAACKKTEGTFTVGFDQNFRRWGLSAMTASIRGLT